MLQRPDLSDEMIASCLSDEYELKATGIAFLALGADADTAVYRVSADEDAAYFLKLRRHGAFAPATVEILPLLHDHGVAPVITPLATTTGRLWTSVGDFALILYPFVECRDGFEVPLSDRQWIELGAAVKRLHTAAVPPAVSQHIPYEEYSSRWRARVRELQDWATHTPPTDRVAAQLAHILRSKHERITDLIERAEQLGTVLNEQQTACVLCHADLHAFNVFIGDDGRLFIVDWDTTTFAPKERDLMFVGAGVGGVWNQAREADLFYSGYGTVEVDQTALAYYRSERIVEDIAVCCDEFLESTAGETARAEALAMLRSQFVPDGVVDIAFRSDPDRMAPPR